MGLGDSRPQPNTFLETLQIVNTVPRPSSVSGIFGQEIQQILAIQNSATLLFVGRPSSSGHSLAQNLPACIISGQEPLDMRRLRFFFQFSDPPHTPAHHAQNGHGDPPAPTRCRLILFLSVSTSALWWSEYLYPRPYILGGRVSNSNQFKSRRVPSSTTMATSLPHVTLVGGFPDPNDPGPSTWALPKE